MPLIWASRVQGTPLPERVAGSSLCLSLSEKLARQSSSIYLLGGNPGVAKQAAQILQDRFPGLRIAGTHCPQIGFEKDAEQLESIRQQLIHANPDVVYVALGSPKTEKLIQLLRHDLPKTWWIGIGISLSFITGEVRRAPRWMQASGMEWIHRMAQEPTRLGKRYLIDGIPFALKLLSYSLLKRFRT
jgi:N-acetylglucosaminyldiphosphoundecaprenol N-acetyl-beta-D-mannosaminyltransferase